MSERLQRYELLDTGQVYLPNYELVPCEPFPGQEWDEPTEWCRAPDVAALEAEVVRLREELASHQEGEARYKRERDELRALLRPFLKFSWTAADKEAVRAYFAALGEEVD